MNRIIYCHISLVFICLLFTTGHIKAQDGLIKPISPTSLNLIRSEFFVYLSGGKKDLRNLWTANNGIYTGNRDLTNACLESGVGVDLSKTQFNLLRVGGFVGYKYGVYSYEKDHKTNSGIHSHWMTTDLNVGFSYLGVGAKSNLFLGSKIRNDDNLSYEGLYEDCFNPVALSWYLSLYFRFTNLKLEARFGTDVIPIFNSLKISYYNLTKTYVDGSYFEVKLSYRIFTSGKVYDAPYIL